MAVPGNLPPAVPNRGREASSDVVLPLPGAGPQQAPLAANPADEVVTVSMGSGGTAGATPAPGRAYSVLGVPVRDVTISEAITDLEGLLARGHGSHAAFFVNAHTLNLAAEVPGYREELGQADRVFGDGTGVRWAVRALHDHQLRANVNGTDIVPLLFTSLAGHGYRYYLLGNTPDRIEQAAEFARRTFRGWEQVGFHHGFLSDGDHDRVIAEINSAQPDLLLVGMGNPLQEQWIARHVDRLDVPLSMGVGGLFDYWVGDLVRAPGWIRRLGQEWMWLLLRQPHKARRYLVGNPKFLWRVAQSRRSGADRLATT